jgi:hypothetical protein
MVIAIEEFERLKTLQALRTDPTARSKSKE